MKIVTFSGFACNGKSTMIDVFSKIFGNEYNVWIFKETARLVDDTMAYFEENLEIGDFEKNILCSEVFCHDIMFEMKKKNEDGLILKDRSIFDVLAFMVLRNETDICNVLDFLRENYDGEKHLSNLYDEILFIRGTSDENFISSILEEDELRKKTISNFFSLQDKFEEVWKRIVKTYEEETEKSLNVKVFSHPHESNLTMWLIYANICSLLGKKSNFVKEF